MHNIGFKKPEITRRSIQLLKIIALPLLLLLLLPAGCTKKVIPPYYGTSQTTHNQSATSASKALYQFYNHWKGTPYALGGMSKNAIDCSGLTVLAFKDVFGLSLPRTVSEQATKGKKVARYSLQPGDLVFFKTGFFQKHVGIYVEENRFIHASSSKGVVISTLDEPYWKNTYWKSTRVYRL